MSTTNSQAPNDDHDGGVATNPDQDGQRRPITIATYNLRGARNNRLETALRALDKMGVSLAILTETHLNDNKHTLYSAGYSVFATTALSAHQGGVALVYQQSPSWQVESPFRHGPNVISFELVSGKTRYPVVGAYIPPNDITTLGHIHRAMGRWATHMEAGKQSTILLGDLNVNFADPKDQRDAEIVAALASYGFEDMLPHFQGRRRHRHGHTWKQKRDGILVSSRCDYILSMDRRLWLNVAIRDPRGYDSDHLMVWGKLLAEPTKSNLSYLQGRRKLPLKLPKWGPQTLANFLYQQLKFHAGAPAHKGKKQREGWISDATWLLVDQRSSLRRNINHDRSEARRLTRKIKASLKTDRKARVAAAGTAIEADLNAGKLREAWGKLKGWYKEASGRAPSPSRQDLDTVTAERITLYTREPPENLGDPIPVLVDGFEIPDNVPDEDEIAEALKKLRSGKAPGPSGLRVDQLKVWYQQATREENPVLRPWRLLVTLVRHIWETSELPTEMTWATMVLLPKPDGGVRGIGLLDVVWKLVMKILDIRIQKNVAFHDVLHGFRHKRGTGTAIIEAKLAQELAAFHQEAFYEIFLDLKKAYDTVDRGRALDIFQQYGVGPKAIRLLQTFWEDQKQVARQGGYYGPPFKASRGQIQGCILSPTGFNIILDAIIRNWLATIIEDDGVVANAGLGRLIAELLAVFFADDGLVASRDPVFLQKGFDILTDLFRRVGLRTNVEKTKFMTCLPGYISSSLSSEAYLHRMTGLGDNLRQRKKRKVSCPHCQKELTTGALPHHLRTQHGVDIQPNYGLPIAHPETLAIYTVDTCTRPNGEGTPCPVAGCAGRPKTNLAMREHFWFRHPNTQITITAEGPVPLPRCAKCGFHCPAGKMGRHRVSNSCKRGEDRRRQREALQVARQASEVTFTACGVQLESVTSFKYLGRYLSNTDSDWPALYKNLGKARQKWARISIMLSREGASPRVSAMFYKAIVQSVLLYGSETWVINPSMLRVLEGFHHRVARRLTGRTARYVHQGGGQWEYPPMDETLEAAGMSPMTVYLSRRQNKLADYVATRPVFDLCVGGDRLSGSATRRKWWWTQPFMVDR